MVVNMLLYANEARSKCWFGMKGKGGRGAGEVEVVELLWLKRRGRSEEAPGWSDRTSTLAKPNVQGAYRISCTLTTTIRLSLCIPASEAQPLLHLHYGCCYTLHHTTGCCMP